MLAEYADRFSRGTSLVHRLDARWKILAALALVAAITIVPAGQRSMYAVLAAVVLGIFAVAGLPWGYLLKRVAVMLPFFVLVAAGVPLSRGLADGFEVAAGIVLRAVLCLIVLLTLVATTPQAALLEALERFRVPRVLTWILAFMYRYAFVLADELARMRRAKLARSFRWNLWSEFRLLGNFAGVLFVRAFERAERVYAAMCARGWNGKLSRKHEL